VLALATLPLPLSRRALIISTALMALGLTACGGSSSTSSATNPQTATASQTPTAAPATSTSQNTAGAPSIVSTGPVRATLSAENHAPTVGRPWHYTVKVADAAGHPLSGTVDIEFAFAGQVVGHDTPPTHPVRNGRWQNNLKFPGAAIGQPLTVRAIVHTHLGSITLNWPITVQK
jgi:hypothetical protein